MSLSFFFQAEDGIRDGRVTGVQTCALPISYGDGTSYGAASPSEPYQNGADPLVRPGSGHAYAAGNGFVALCRVYFYNCSAQRSEERRVGKEDRARGSPAQRTTKQYTHAEVT